MTNQIHRTIMILFLFIFCVRAEARDLISSSAEEIEYSYSTKFRTTLLVDDSLSYSAKYFADFHASHLFGILSSPQYAEKFGVSADMIAGFAGPKFAKVTNARFEKYSGDPYFWVSYSAKGQALVLREVLNQWIGQSRMGTTSLPMLVDLPAIYASSTFDRYKSSHWRACTDTSYWTAADFSYFYNPWSCAELQRPPVAQSVDLQIVRTQPYQNMPNRMPIQKLQSENSNGKLVVLYFISGFDKVPPSGSSDKKIKNDLGWQLYDFIDAKLTGDLGFTKMQTSNEFFDALGSDSQHLQLLTPITLKHDLQRRYFSTYIKKTESVTWVVRSALFNTENQTGSEALMSFPKFWKEAWENGDFIYYSGHSSDGETLSFDNMLSNLSRADIDSIQFQHDKTQIAYFDSCSSYAYFENMYSQLKPRNLDIMSYGVVSYFHTANASIETILQLLMGSNDPLWQDALLEIEKSHLWPHVQSMYEPMGAQRVYNRLKKQGERPRFLLNVSDN